MLSTVVNKLGMLCLVSLYLQLCISVCCGSLFPSFFLSSSFSFHPFLQGWIHNSPFFWGVIQHLEQHPHMQCSLVHAGDLSALLQSLNSDHPEAPTACSESASSTIMRMQIKHFFSAQPIENNMSAYFLSHAIAVFLVKHRQLKKPNHAHFKWLLKERLMDKLGISWLWRWHLSATSHNESFGVMTWYGGMLMWTASLSYTFYDRIWRVTD